MWKIPISLRNAWSRVSPCLTNFLHCKILEVIDKSSLPLIELVPICFEMYPTVHCTFEKKKEKRQWLIYFFLMYKFVRKAFWPSNKNLQFLGLHLLESSFVLRIIKKSFFLKIWNLQCLKALSPPLSKKDLHWSIS